MNFSIKKTLEVFVRHPFLLVPFVFYLLTASPTIGLGDTAILMDAMYRGHLSVHVNNHPLTVAVGWLFTKLPFGDLSYRCNLVSVLFGGLTVSCFYLTVFSLFSRRLTAVLAASMLMVSYSLWWHSTLVENYAVTAFLVALYLYLLVQWRLSGKTSFLYGMFGVSGLGIANHVQMGFMGVGCLIALVYHLYQMRQLREQGQENIFKGALRTFLSCGIAGVVGLLPWLLLLGKEAIALGSLRMGLKEAFFGKFQGIMLQGSWYEGLKDSALLLVQQSPGPFLVVLLIGPFMFCRAWRLSPHLLAVFVPFLINSWFFLSYDTWDRYAFLLLSFVLVFFMASFALHPLVMKFERKSWRVRALGGVAALLSLACAPWFYAQLSRWGDDPESFWHQKYNNRYTHNTYRVHEYIVNPNKRSYTDVDEYVRLLFARLPERAIYIDDDARAYYPVEFYQRHYGLRQDLSLHIINSWGFSGWGLTIPAFHRMLGRLVRQGGEVFVVSRGYPFQQALQKFRQFERLVIEPFYLDETRWVYRVKARDKDAAASKLSLGRGGERVELGRSDVFKHSGLSEILDQDMSGFGEAWSNLDQLFVRSDIPRDSDQRTSASLEFKLVAEAAGEGELELGLTRAPDFGKVRVVWNDRVLDEDLDLYNERVIPWTVDRLIELRAGENTLRFDLLPAGPSQERRAYGFDFLRLKSFHESSLAH